MNLEKVKDLIMPYLEANSLQLYAIERVKEYGYVILRVSIDRPEGIDLETLAKCNEYLSLKLDAIDEDWEEYMLEVSSPGAEKELRNLVEVKKSIGQYVHAEVADMVYEGTLEAVLDDAVIVIRYNAKGRFKTVKLAYQDLKLIRLAVKI